MTLICHSSCNLLDMGMFPVEVRVAHPRKFITRSAVRLFRREKELKVALDIVEGIFAPMFGHEDAAEQLTSRVPPRPPRPEKKK